MYFSRRWGKPQFVRNARYGWRAVHIQPFCILRAFLLGVDIHGAGVRGKELGPSVGAAIPLRRIARSRSENAMRTLDVPAMGRLEEIVNLVAPSV